MRATPHHKAYDHVSGRLPARYVKADGASEFHGLLREAVKPGTTVLDLGSGRSPAVPLGDRPDGMTYVGLDLSSAELRRAPAGSYDEMHVADACEHVPGLDARFDVVLSFQVLEHVRPLDDVVANVRRYLRPGGRFVAQFSGTFSLFGIINKVIPQKVGLLALEKLLQRDPDTVFPAHYHHCYDAALRKMLADWSAVDIVPIYTGAHYLRFSRPLQTAYLAYENWTVRTERRNLASYYVVDAIR